MSTLEDRVTLFREVFGMPEQATALIRDYEIKVEGAKQKFIDAGI